MLTTLQRYVLRLWMMPFLIMFILVNALFLIQKVMIWLPKLVEHEATLHLMVMLFVSMMPLDLTMTIPIAYFFALIKLVRDLQANSELDAMYAGGRSIINVLAPIFWVGVVLTFVMLWLTLELSPASKVVTYNTASKLTLLNASPSFEPRMFISDIEGLVFYYDGKNADGTYANFMLTDSRSKTNELSTYFANRAQISGIDEGLLVRLLDGSQLIGERDKVRSIYFSNYEIVIPLKTEHKYYRVDPKADVSFMGAKDLFQAVFKDDVSVSYIAHWNFRLVLGLSVLVLFFYAVPISLRAKRAKQGGVFLWAILVMWVINQTELVLFKKIELSLLPWWSLWGGWLSFMSVGVWMFYMVYRRGAVSFRLGKRKIL